MKVNDLKRQLDEGFLDNLISKISAAAGGDGATGIIRALRGSNAALRKVSDAVANTARPRIQQRLGNQIDAINSGTAPLPVKLIYQQTLVSADRIADQERISVNAAQISQTLKSNRMDIERLIQSSNPGSNNELNLIMDAIIGGTGTARVGIELEPAIGIISLIVAATMIFVETQQQDSGEVEIDPAALEEFKTASAALSRVLFLQTSPDFVSLMPNLQLIENLEELVTITMLTGATGIQKRYLNITAEQMQAVQASVPDLVNTATVTRLLSSHDTVDAAVVAAVVAKVVPLIQAQFEAWLKIAVTEAPPRASSFDIYKQWAKTVYDSLDRIGDKLKASPTTPAALDRAGEPIPPAGEPIPPAGEPTPPADVEPDIESIIDAVKKLSKEDKTKLTGQLLSVIGGGEPTRR